MLGLHRQCLEHPGKYQHLAHVQRHRFDTTGSFNTSTYIWTAPAAGTARVHCQVSFNGMSAGATAQLVVNYNGSTLANGPTAVAVTETLNGQVVICAALDRLVKVVAGDQLQMWVRMSAAGAVVLDGTREMLIHMVH